MQSQYGIRLSRELHGMKWREFVALLSGLDAKTPLGRVVSIRSENDPKVLKNFTKGQMRIRNKWQRRRVKEIAPEEYERVLEQLKNAFISLAK